MNILILAAGFGTRLYPLTYDLPKALIKINNQPLINHTIEKINEIPEIENIYILSNNKFYINFLEWKEDFKHLTNKKIKIINNGIDKVIDARGVMNDLKFVLKIINHNDLFILGSDNLYLFDLKKIINKGKEKQASVTALKEIGKKAIGKKYACILLDEDNKIINCEEKPENPKSDLASIFCYYLIKKDLDKIKDQESFKTGNIIEHLYENTPIYGEVFKEPWYDIGSLEELKQAEQYFLNQSSQTD